MKLTLPMLIIFGCQARGRKGCAPRIFESFGHFHNSFVLSYSRESFLLAFYSEGLRFMVVPQGSPVASYLVLLQAVRASEPLHSWPQLHQSRLQEIYFPGFVHFSSVPHSVCTILKRTRFPSPQPSWPRGLSPVQVVSGDTWQDKGHLF